MSFIEEIKAYQPRGAQEEEDRKIILDYIQHFPQNILTRANKIAHMTSSGLILNPSLDKILMIHHNIYDTWTWTGGHADGAKNLLHVAMKEAAEETGAQSIRPLTEQLASVDILPVYGHMKRGAYVSAHLHLNTSYVLIADESDKLIVNEDETTGVGWVPVDKLDDYSSEPYFIDIYRKLVDWARNNA